VAAEAEKQNLPGPGAYNLSTDIRVTRKAISFSKTGTNIEKHVLKEETPGPGQYNVVKRPQTAIPVKRRPFNSTTGRFNKSNTNPDLAPGSYELEEVSSLVTAVKKKIAATPQHPFGSTVVRFVDRDKAILKVGIDPLM
jgi:hypothetical protein